MSGIFRDWVSPHQGHFRKRVNGHLLEVRRISGAKPGQPQYTAHVDGQFVCECSTTAQARAKAVAAAEDLSPRETPEAGGSADVAFSFGDGHVLMSPASPSELAAAADALAAEADTEALVKTVRNGIVASMPFDIDALIARLNAEDSQPAAAVEEVPQEAPSDAVQKRSGAAFTITGRLPPAVADFVMMQVMALIRQHGTADGELIRKF